MLGINIPDNEIGDWRIETIDGECTLFENSFPRSVMKDCSYEVKAHEWLWKNATGDILVAGLGIGFLNKVLIDYLDFDSVTIIENSQDVIDLVWPYCARDSRFTLIKEDIETWEVPAGSHWDIGWFDVWYGNNPLSLSAHLNLMKHKYGEFCDKIGTRLYDCDLQLIDV
tara:strand:- start:177 stop:683 length:507 start_codon:yes stop_codon:yes gene_type:complete